MKINPAILVDDVVEYQRQLEVVASYTDEVDIDIIDWQRTPAKTISIEQALAVNTPLILNFDLMMDDPEAAIHKVAQDPRVKTVIINMACIKEKKEMAALIRNYKKVAGLSVNPDNDLEDFQGLLVDFDLVQIFTIEPGAQGNQMLPERLELITEIKKLGYTGLIETDGGFKDYNAQIFLKYPFDIISVGSALSQAQKPQQIYADLTAKLPRS